MNETASRATGRLNPFAFPSDTSFRFILLVAAIVGASLFAFDWTYSTFTDTTAEARGMLTCSLLIGDGVPDDAQLGAFRSCMVALQAPRLVFGLIGVTITLGFGLILYLYGFRRRRRHFEPLDPVDAPNAAAALAALSTEAGLERGPAYVWDPLDARINGVAFGPPGGRLVGLSGGLVVAAATDPPTFRAVVLHELAHLRNRDVDYAHFAVAVSRVVLAMAAIPLILILISLAASDPEVVIGIAWRLAVLVTLVYVIRNGLLRSRELDADVRASTQEPAIRRVLGASADPPGSIVARLMRLHPPGRERLAAVEDPGRLLRFSLLDAFLVGVIGTLAYDDVSTILSYYRFDTFAVAWLATLVFAPLVAAVIVVGAWRGAFRDLVRGPGVSRGIPMGGALAIGLLTGQYLSFTTAISSESVILGTSMDLTDVLLAATVFICAILLVSWAATTAAVWLPRTGRRASPRRAVAVGALVGAFVLSVGTALLVVLTESRELLGIIGNAMVGDALTLGDLWVGPASLFTVLMSPAIAIFTSEPLLVLAILAVVIFPLAGMIGGPAAATPVRWGALDVGDRGPIIEARTVSPRLPLLTGLVCGLGVLVVLVLGRLWLRGAISLETRSLDDFGLVATFWTRSVVVLGAIVATVIVAVRARRFGATLGLAAAVVACAVGTLAVFGLQGSVPCFPGIALREGGQAACGDFPDALFYWDHFTAVLAPACIAAVVLGGPVALLRERLSARQPARVSREPADQPV